MGGLGGSEDLYAVFGTRMPGVKPPHRTGYTFAGYYADSACRGTRYYDSNGNSAHVWDAPDTTTLYAKWLNNGYTCGLNNLGGSGCTSVYVRYGLTMPSVPVPVRSGYVFGGYWTTTRGVGTQYFDAKGHAVRTWDRPHNSATLYAYWIRR